ncbi:MAG: hypothetical protein COU29_03820 [Candidatus Magasanikbacteria bacterium CG10_big_fil_rev_8_21_14_0_10_36_32]|uniref:ATP-grasp domain-containing protein n=1 Tax=Candidatus Magasanikbacteria bacterium CG10_big_fil_rev_8_21_14_0_10_36_32 TaxID=1974646 RepID=A0A2M6W5M8_9BACT|nr:MAG: hypothetical protein COU29_03820 [Candidatus Magasanikbacteria bacterium CG10_big_fil_rev_8_21_14_0_10_36_32]
MKANNPHKKAKKRRIFYICRDLERALGMEQNQPDYFIITNATGFARKIAKTNKRIILISEKKTLDTREMLAHPQTAENISAGDYVMVFKNTIQIENICLEHKWQLLNPPAILAAQVEEKISQVLWLGSLKKFLPLIKIDKLKNVTWTGTKFILQYNRSHTGSGTILITSSRQLSKIKKQFPEREARLSKFIDGPMFTNNNIVWNKKIMTGNINYQITGLKPFTDNKFATVGNDWFLPDKILTPAQIKQYKKIAIEVGKKLSKDGWRGLYGIDAVLETKTGRLYLIEINARQPASTTYESQLQQRVRDKKQSITVFDAHLSSLLNLNSNGLKLIKINNGAQIIQRVTADIYHLPKIKINKKNNFNFIQYQNEKIDSDLLRIQTDQGIMSKHKTFNDCGLKLIKFIKTLKY